MIVEDDVTISRGLKEYLNQWGFVSETITDFQHVLEEIKSFEADLVLMDISLPFYNGFYWCQMLRKTSQLPIIFLSSASDNMNMIMAMNMGADDFVAKPFDLQVLIAKIQALLRRSYEFGGQAPLVFSYGDYAFFPQENLLQLGDQQVTLTPNESRILTLLFQQAGEIVTREAIMTELWESDDFIDRNTLAVNMTRLRKKLSVIDLDSRILTIKNKGYMLEAANEN